MLISSYATRLRLHLHLHRSKPVRAHFTYSTSTFEWNSAIKSHITAGHFDSALAHYRLMRHLGIPHDTFTFPIVNQAISSLGSSLFRYGRIVHALALQMGFASDVYFCNTMIGVYVRDGALSDARHLFDEMCVRDLVTWTSMIAGYVQGGKPHHVVSAFALFERMRYELVQLNSVGLIVMLHVCCASRCATVGLQFHCYVLKLGFMADLTVQNSVLKMYANTKLYYGNEVEDIFGEAGSKDVISWNALMSHYTGMWKFEMVIKSFNNMRTEIIDCRDTLPLVISAVAKAGRQPSEGEMLHCLATKIGLHDTVLKTSIIDLYAKCGEIEKSLKVFYEDPFANNEITGCTMVSGLNHNRQHQQAIELSIRIRALGYHVGAAILKEIVISCAHLGTLQMGKAVHCYQLKNMHNQEHDTTLETCILNFYIRCGNIRSATHCFDMIHCKDIVVWTSMVEGLGNHGRGLEALSCFDQMIKEGIEPNGITFLSLMSACSHSGLLKEGCEVIWSMRWKHKVEPELEHYTSLVDLLGRSGKLKEALSIILKMVDHADSRIWGALLSACRVHGCIKMGEYAAQMLLQLEPDNGGYYTLLSNIGASGEKWEEVEALRRLVNKDWKTEPGWSSIECNTIGR